MNRNSPGRRVPGSPLAGVLRQTARNARSTTRRTSVTPGPQGEPGPEGPPGAPATGVAVAVAAAVVTDTSGVAVVEYPATAVASAVATPVSDVPVVVTLVAAGATSSTFSVWNLDGSARPGAELYVVVCGEPAPVDLDPQPGDEGN